MQEFAATAPYSQYIETRPSKTEGGTGPAIYVKPDVKTINPVAHKIFYEVAHVHPAENSLHVYASPQDAKLVMKRGWGHVRDDQRWDLRLLYNGQSGNSQGAKMRTKDGNQQE